MFEKELSDLRGLTHMVGDPLRKVLKELCPLTDKVVEWHAVPTSGFVICRYNTATHAPDKYEVTAQTGNWGNLVHELTHVAVNEAYRQDFVNYPNPTAKDVPPPVYDAVGRRKNEADRQTKYMDAAWNDKVWAQLRALKLLANSAAKDLSARVAGTSKTRAEAFVEKLDYGIQWPHREYDTVINQTFVWLYEWDCAEIPTSQQKGKTAIVSLFNALKKAVDDAYQRRQTGVA